ncbi:hypothetical protein KAJ27_17020 [bacterium]|nr:hypothetical protein [bacterium]
MYILDHLQKDESDKWDLVFKDKDGKDVVQKSEGDQFCMSKLMFIKINRSDGEDAEIKSVVLGLQDQNEKLWNVYLFGDYMKETSPNRIKVIKKEKLYFDKKNPKSLKRFNAMPKSGEYGKKPDDQFGFSIEKKWKTLVGGIHVMSLKRGKKDELLIGTRNNGLLVLDEKRKRIKRLTVKSSDGKMPSNTVTAAARIADDIWIGTNKGLVIWDGLNFKNIDAFNELIAENIITDIETTNKRVFVGTTMGLTVMNKNGGWTTYTKEEGNLANNQITRIVATTKKMGKEKVILGTKKGAFIFNENECIPFEGTIAEDWINDIVIDRTKPGGVWFSFPGGVEKFPFEEETLAFTYATEKYTVENGLPEEWMKTVGMEVYRTIKGYSPKWLDATDPSTDTNLMDDPYVKILWVGGMKKIYSWNGVSWTDYDFAIHKIPGSIPQKIMVDNRHPKYASDNRIYVGTDKGVSVYKAEENFTGIPPFSGIVNPGNSDIHDFVKFQGDIWIATNTGPANLSQLILYHNGRPCNWPFYDNKILDLEVVDQTHLVGAIQNGGLFVYNGFDKPDIYDSETCGFPSDEITAIYYDSKNTMMYCGAKKSGALNERVFKFPFYEPEKWMWIDEEKNKPHEKRKHIGDARQQSTERVTGFAQVGEKLYIGTKGSGLYEVGPKAWKCYYVQPEASHGLEGNYIRKMIVDSFQNLWLATEEGLTRLMPDGKWETFKKGTTTSNLSEDDFFDIAIRDQNTFRIWGVTSGTFNRDCGIVAYFDGDSWWNFSGRNFRKVFNDFPHLWLWKKGLWIIKMSAVNLTHNGNLLIKGGMGSNAEVED